MDRPHILNENGLYYKMKTWELYSLLKNQDLLIKFTKLLELSEKQLEEIYYKRHCILFEIHRRAFQNCLIQLYSVSKVRCWLRDMDNERRCDCCNLEYYEFHADLRRIERSIQECSNNVANLLADKSSTEQYSSIDSEPAIPSGPELLSPSRAYDDTVSALQNSNFSRPIDDEPSRLPEIAPLSLNDVISFSGTSTPSSGVECLFERAEGEIGPAYTPRSILKSSKADFTMFEYKSQSVFKNRFIQTLPFTRRKRPYVTFNLCNARSNPIQYHYENHNEGESSSAAEKSTSSAHQISSVAHSSAIVSNHILRVEDNYTRETISTRNNNDVQFTSRSLWSFIKTWFK